MEMAVSHGKNADLVGKIKEAESPHFFRSF